MSTIILDVLYFMNYVLKDDRELISILIYLMHIFQTAIKNKKLFKPDIIFVQLVKNISSYVNTQKESLYLLFLSMKKEGDN